MTTIAAGAFQRLVGKKQSALGTKATAGSAQVYSFTTADLNLEKDSFQSAEIRPSMQVAHGGQATGRTSGKIGVELGVGAYQDFIGSLLRTSWSTVSAYAAGSDVTAAATAPHFVDASGGFLTAGLKVGMIGRWTGFAGDGATANNSRNFLITALTATDMSGIFLDGTAVVADAAGDSVTFTPVGKVAFPPQSGQTRDYWTFGLEQSDVSQYDDYIDSAITAMNIKIPVGGFAAADFSVMGLDQDTSESAYFTTPTAASTGAKLSAVDGAAVINGAVSTLLKDVSLTVNGGFTRPDGNVGTDREHDVLPGNISVSGSANMLFADSATRDLFSAGTECAICFVLATSGSATAGTMSFFMSKCLINSFTKTRAGNDIGAAITFTAYEDLAGGTGTNANATTITIQDSAAV